MRVDYSDGMGRHRHHLHLAKRTQRAQLMLETPLRSPPYVWVLMQGQTRLAYLEALGVINWMPRQALAGIPPGMALYLAGSSG